VEQPGSSGTRLGNTTLRSAGFRLHLEAISSRICHQKVSQKHRNQGSAEEETQAVEEPQHANPTSLHRSIALATEIGAKINDFGGPSLTARICQDKK